MLCLPLMSLDAVTTIKLIWYCFCTKYFLQLNGLFMIAYYNSLEIVTRFPLSDSLICTHRKHS